MNANLLLRQVIVYIVYSIIFGFFLFLLSYFLGTGLEVIIFSIVLAHVVQWYFSDRITLTIMGARLMEPGEKGYSKLKELVSKISKKAKLPEPKIGIMDSRNLNAFATGPYAKKSIVCVTSGMLDSLNEKELEAVLGHELSHIKNKDVITLMISGMTAAIVYYVSRILIYSQAGERRSRENPLILFAVLGLFIYFILRLSVLAVSRYREYIADESSARLQGNASPMISALEKISGSTGMKNIQGRESLSYLLINNPFSGSSLLELFSTHPPIEKRIERLNGLKI